LTYNALSTKRKGTLVNTVAQKNYAKKCLVAAKQGNEIAQNTLGFLHLHGQGVEKDYDRAAKWFKQAANQHYAPAQFNLAIMYKLGQGVAQNYTESIKWLQRAAKQDYLDAQTNLGNVFYQGLGTVQDYEMAYVWWTIAQQNGAKDIEHTRNELVQLMTGQQLDNAKKLVENFTLSH
jgi:TPR repeat protein